MIKMCRKFYTNNITCLKGRYDELCQMLRTCQAALIKIHVFCQDLEGYHLQFLEVISLYNSQAGKQIARCREDCCDLSSLQSAGKQLSPKFAR